jgi:exonuclease VII small subunit
VYEGTPITSGRFTEVAGFDKFDGFSASETYPPFPGEDYLLNSPMGVSFPIDLGDGMSKAVISVEPDIMGVDPTGEGPFSIKPLLGNIPEGAQDHVNYEMMTSMSALPTGLVVIYKDSMRFMSTIEELETQVSRLQSEKSDLEEEVSELETAIMDLESMEVSMVPLGSWQAISLIALFIGIAIGAVIIYLRK